MQIKRDTTTNNDVRHAATGKTDGASASPADVPSIGDSERAVGRPVMNSTPTQLSDSAAIQGGTGPGTSSYAAELRDLQRAVADKASDVDERIRQLFTRHKVREFLADLVGQSALDTESTPGVLPSRSELGMTSGAFRVYGSTETPYDMVKYHEKLAKLMRKVETGELSLDQARRKAGFPHGFNLLAMGSQHAMEIANLAEGKGVLVSLGPSYGSKPNHERTAVVTLTDLRPNTYTTFRHSWRDLDSRVVLDKQHRVIVTDQTTPEKSYETILLLLRYVGELGKELISER